MAARFLLSTSRAPPTAGFPTPGLGLLPTNQPSPPHPRTPADLSLLKPSVLQQVASAAPVCLVADPGTQPQTGLVLSVAPLMGATPAVDARHPRWLHVQVREGGGFVHGNAPCRSHPCRLACAEMLMPAITPADAADPLQVRPPLRGLLKVLAASHAGNALLNIQKHLVR